MIECPDCDGSGIDENFSGCGDPECCGTNTCWTCAGEGEIEEEE